MKKLLSLIWESITHPEGDYTNLSINKAIFLLSVPMVLEMTMEGLFGVVDAYFVGMINNEAVTTIGLTETVNHIVYSLALGISIAATAMVARRTGEIIYYKYPFFYRAIYQ